MNHFKRLHDAPASLTLTEVVGTKCPVCGVEGIQVGGHVSKSHGEIVPPDARRYGMGWVGLMWADENGDPYGVAAKVRQAGRDWAA